MREDPTETQAPFPLFVRVDGAKVVCVGAGRCAERKIEALVGHGACPTVIAPTVTPRVRELAEAGAIELVERAFRPGDLAGALLVIGATDDTAVNHEVYLEASAHDQLVNVVDDPENCNAIVPSVLRRGKFQLAVSTDGAAPGLARKLRRGLEGEFPEWYGDYIDLLGELRALVKARVPGGASARTPLYEALYSCGLEDRIARGERPSAECVYAQVVEPLLEGSASR